MKVKGSKIFHNVKIHWINMFNPSKKGDQNVYAINGKDG